MKRSVLTGFLAVFMLASSQAQPITISEADVRARLEEGDFAFQMLVAGLDIGGEMSPEDSLALQNSMQAILDEVGEGGTFDLTGIDFTLFTDVALEVQALPVSDEIPGAGVFNATDAEYVSSNAGFFGTAYNYLGIENDGLYDYGTAVEGEEPDVYDPPARTMALPLEMGTTWSRVTESSFLGITTKDSTYAEVVGYGELVTPGGSAPSLVVREETFSEVLGSTETSVTYTMYTRDLRMSANIQVDEDGVPVGILYSVESSASADPVAVASGFTGDLLSALGLDIDLTSASATDGALQAFRIDFIPAGGEFSGSAESGNGSQITPDMVVGDGYYVVHATGLSGFEYRVCMNYEGVDVDPGSLVILRREDTASPWMPQASTRNESTSEVCASGLTAFSHFALGANSSDVGTAVEDGTELASDFVLYGSAPNPARDVTTIRYELARSTDVTLQVFDALGREVATLVDGWQRNGAQEARFDASSLPNGLYVYRLTAGGVTDSRSLIVVK